MSAMEWVADDFEPQIIKRGDEYFDEGLVRIAKMDATRVVARVAGSQLYKVTLNFDEGDFEWRCTCPYDMGPCKHIWATVRAAEEEGWPPIIDWEGEDDLDFASMIDLQPIRRAWSTQKRFRDAAPNWQEELRRVKDHLKSGYYRDASAAAPEPWPAQREICYVIDVGATIGQQDGLYIEVMTREPKKSGQLGKWKRAPLAAWQWAGAPPEDQRIAQMLIGCQGEYGHGSMLGRFRVESAVYRMLLLQICETGRCRLRAGSDQQPGEVLQWDDGAAWEFRLEVRPSDSDRSSHLLTGSFRRGDERMELSEPRLVLMGGVLVARGALSRLNHHGAFELLAMLRRQRTLPLSDKKLPALLKELCELPQLPPIDWPTKFVVEEIQASPRMMLKIRPNRNQPEYLIAELSFAYEAVNIAEGQTEAAIAQTDARRMIRRDLAAEAAAKQRLEQLGCRNVYNYYRTGPTVERQLHKNQLNAVVLNLIREGWRVEAEGKLFRSGGKIEIEVNSGIDWFDLNGRADFGETSIALPKLLAALENGQNTVLLDDGTMGLVPEQWLRKYAPLAQLGKAQGDSIRFSRAQAGFLDALLAGMPEATCDQTFARVREELAAFKGVAPADPPDAFIGTLRDYQKEGLGWLHFLEKFGFGGCLADDMGLGKTVQVLALLEERRAHKRGTSLAVVPRSLIFNWKQEAARFAPRLRVLDHSSPARKREALDLAGHDLVLTTYGTLRRDIARLNETEFDYVILDESQAIKNAGTQSAKAARLLRARHRLALSGTPIENHLGELWSLFEFLNPGMLASAGVFRSLVQHNGQVHDEGKSLLAKALRPFILRRTKGQVARELPDKVEQTIFCELQGEQRKLYDELKEHYRASLLGLIEKKGIARSKIQILEALLRLRQAACHPALIDKSYAAHPSAKLESLLEHLKEVVAEKHKVLVFSQFTSLLAIVKAALQREKIEYEYLDGQTRNRQEKVEHFQNDPAYPVFLISLKAGGVGLNLTSAEYVFLLDPWWNPAVEAQAVDRAHRIGQGRTVFAYRLIARDTVEEKVLELQRTKRDLAEAIITQDNSLIARMGTDELRMLLS